MASLKSFRLCQTLYGVEWVKTCQPTYSARIPSTTSQIRSHIFRII